MFAALLIAMQDVPVPPGPQPGTDIVVTARAGPPPPDRFAERLRAACLDPMRRRRPVAPPDDTGWIALPELSARLPAARADSIWERAADEQGRTLTLLVERAPHPWRTVRTRCTLTAADGTGHDALPGLVAQAVGGMTQRHVGRPDGVEAKPGWQQWLATFTPSRGSAGWSRPPGRRTDSYTVVIDPAFYASADHVAVEVRTRDDGRLTIATVTLVERPPLARARR